MSDRKNLNIGIRDIKDFVTEVNIESTLKKDKNLFTKG